MANTPILGLPYPAESDPADVPLDVQKLAAALDAFGLAFFQPGDLKLSAAIQAPTGWLVCDGRAVSRGTYAALFAAIGTSFGTGDGSTTFALPDFRGRSPVGVGAGAGLTARTLGAAGGEEAHGLSVTEMPSHAHGVSDPGHAHGVADPGHSHGIQNYFTGGGANNLTAGGTFAAHQANVYATNGSGTGIGIYGAATGVGVQANGGSAAHNNMAPFTAVNVLIKY